MFTKRNLLNSTTIALAFAVTVGGMSAAQAYSRIDGMYGYSIDPTLDNAVPGQIFAVSITGDGDTNLDSFVPSAPSSLENVLHPTMISCPADGQPSVPQPCTTELPPGLGDRPMYGDYFLCTRFDPALPSMSWCHMASVTPPGALSQR